MDTTLANRSVFLWVHVEQLFTDFHRKAIGPPLLRLNAAGKPIDDTLAIRSGGAKPLACMRRHLNKDMESRGPPRSVWGAAHRRGVVKPQ